MTATTTARPRAIVGRPADPSAEAARSLRVETDDYPIDMSTARGVHMMFRLAERLSASSIVPEAYQSHIKRKVKGGGEEWVENPSAVGNIMIAMETARQLRLPLSTVMMHGYPIEGRMGWSAQFVMGMLGASGRFKPLRFETSEGDMLRATWTEKAWSNEKSKFEYTERSADVRDRTCRAWAVPASVEIPNGINTIEAAKAIGLPVMVSPQISMQMAIEEGWYARNPKWRGAMAELMLHYRAGAFFGRIHAPDLFMGLGQTVEEIVDVQAVEIPPRAEAGDSPEPPAQRGQDGPEVSAPTPEAEAQATDPADEARDAQREAASGAQADPAPSPAPEAPKRRAMKAAKGTLE